MPSINETLKKLRLTQPRGGKGKKSHFQQV